MENKKDTIGIIGGSGAFATSYLLQKINEYSVLMHQASNDQDFLHTITISTPFTALNHQGFPSKNTLHHLIQLLHQLESIDCNIIVLACNTLHQYWENLNQAKIHSSTTILHLPQIVSSYVSSKDKIVGILSSEQTRLLQLYEPFLQFHQKLIYVPLKIQSKINDCIQSVIQNKIDVQIQQNFHDCLAYLFDNQVDSIILGCTELSILKKFITYPKIYDSVELLAMYLNQYFSGKS